MATLIAAQVLDPLRIVLVLLALWLVSKLYDQGARWIPNLVAMAAISVVLTVVLASMQTGVAGQWAATAVFGFASNCLIWAIAYGLFAVYRKMTAS